MAAQFDVAESLGKGCRSMGDDKVTKTQSKEGCVVCCSVKHTVTWRLVIPVLVLLRTWHDEAFYGTR